MEAVGRLSKRWFCEVVCDARAVRIREVGALKKRVESCAGLFQVADAGHDVNDGLGGEAGYCCRADVVDATLKPRGEYVFQERALGFEVTRPVWVVRHDDDLSASHRRSIARQDAVGGEGNASARV